jgi:hypothetical protein
MKWAGHVARLRDMRGAHKTFVGKLGEQRPLVDLGLYERMALKCISKK